MIPTHASIQLNSYTSMDNLKVDSIDYQEKTVTVLIPFSETESIKKKYSFSSVKSFTFPNCVNELV
jgi:hypothetical protein